MEQFLKEMPSWVWLTALAIVAVIQACKYVKKEWDKK